MSKTHLIHPNCCDAMRKHQAITLRMPIGFDEGDIDTPPHWVIQSYRPFRVPDLDKWDEWPDPEPDMPLNESHTKDVAHCPFCARQLPPIVRVDVDKKVCMVTDGGYYCDTCKERLRACTCLPPAVAWGPLKISHIEFLDPGELSHTIEFLDPEERYVAKIGDVLWGTTSDWAKPREEGWEQNPEYQERVSGLKLNVLDGTEFTNNQILMICCVHPNPIRAAEILGLNTEFFCGHKDPYTGAAVYAIIPTAILTDDIHKYADCLQGVPFPELALDSEFAKDMNGKQTFKPRPFRVDEQEINEIFKLTHIQSLMSGSGYTFGCLQNDGHHYQLPAKVKMDNGDWLFVWFWEWYNK